MSSPVKKEDVFLLDANILMDLGRWVPIELNQSFWKVMEESLKSGKWVLLDVVVAEVKYEGELKKWCKKQSNNSFVSKLSDENKNRGAEINLKYPMIDQNTRKSETDTYIIAYAEEKKLVVFSREGPKKLGQSLYKIPDVCDALGVNWFRTPIIFYKNIGVNKPT